MIRIKKTLCNKDKIIEAIENSIKQEATVEFERAKKEMIERLDKRKDEIIAGISISIMEYVMIERMGNQLVIRIETQKLK